MTIRTRLDDRHGLVDVARAQKMFDRAPALKPLHIFERGNHNAILVTTFRGNFCQGQAFIDSLPT